MMLAFFIGYAARFLVFVDSLISAVSQAPRRMLQRQSTFFEECEVVHFARRKRRR